MHIVKKIVIGTVVVLALLFAVTPQTFAMTAPGTEPLKLLTPNGGEQWMLNSSEKTIITWTPEPHSDDIEAYLETKNKNGTYKTVGKVVVAGKGSIRWGGEIDTYGKYATAGSGYYIRLVNTKTGATDRSDAPFTILPVNAMAVTLTPGDANNLLSITKAQDVKLAWNVKGPVSECTLTIRDVNGDQVSSEVVKSTGTKTVRASLPDTSINGDDSYTLANVSCSGSLGQRGDYLQITAPPTITVTSPPTGNRVSIGGFVQISWVGTNLKNTDTTITIENAPGAKAFKKVVQTQKDSGGYRLALPLFANDPMYIPAGNYIARVTNGTTANVASGISGVFTVTQQGGAPEASISIVSGEKTMNSYTVYTGETIPPITWTSARADIWTSSVKANNGWRCNFPKTKWNTVGKTASDTFIPTEKATDNNGDCVMTFTYTATRKDTKESKTATATLTFAKKPTPTVTLDNANITTASTTPIISGSAQNAQTVGITLGGPGGDKIWGSGSVPVVNNRWSIMINTPEFLSPGTYTVYVDSNNVVLATGKLTILPPPVRPGTQIRVEPISESASVDQSDYTGDIEKGVFEIQVEITAVDGDIYIPEGVGASTTMSIGANPGFRASITDIGTPFVGQVTEYISDETSPDQVNSNYGRHHKILEGRSATFTMRYELAPTNQGGTYGVSLDSIRFSGTATGTLMTHVLPDIEGYETNKVTIDGSGQNVIVPGSGSQITVAPVSEVAAVNEAQFTGDVDRGIFEIEVEISAMYGDVYIQDSVAEMASSGAGFVYSVTSNGVPFNGRAVAYISEESSMEEINNRYRIPEGTSDTFTIRVELLTYASSSGQSYGISMDGIRFSGTPTGSLAIFTVPDESEFETDKKTIDGTSSVPPRVSSNIITPTVAQGATGEKVSLIQTALKNAGYFTHEVTGYFGNITKNAVATFQQANALDNIGAVGPRTATLLNQLLGF